MIARKKKFIWLAVAAAVFISLVSWIAWGNTALELNAYTISSSRLPDSFNGFRIAHVSDLHNAEMGKGNEKLLTMLRDAEPDMIVITGDLVDSRNTDIGIALEFAKEAVKIAPCYYVTGNHEARIAEYDDLKMGLEKAGVVVLRNARAEVEQDGECISVLGVDDPSFQTDYLFGDANMVISSGLAEIRPEDGSFTILLSHRPELFDTYVTNGMDLVFSGHAHGGQFRLPFFGGLIAPNQGLFPQYDARLFAEGNTTMVVSKGIGNSIIPIRFNNRPEIIVVVLETA